MSSSGVPILLITANVGSIFEEPDVMLKLWTEEFLSTVARLDPKFVALHCQEVGGKNYAESMRHVEDFVRLLMNSEELRLFDKVRVFLDEDFSSAEHFTALGNLYFAHESLKDVQLWDFKDSSFVPVNPGNEIHSGNIEAVTTKEKAKFPQDFFPECKWSRKGFLRTRWSISGTVFDLINIHLFHDASNFIAMETFPSVYSKTRRRALEHTLDRFHNDQYPNVPYFLFGDFNFRTDTAGVIKKLTADTRESKQSNKGSLSKLQFRNESDDLILTLGKKEFSHHEHQQVFVENSGQWLREYDKELGDFEGRLFEFPINFVPSYPFEENVKEGTNYMQTRVPAWCDRILLSPTAKTLVKDVMSSDSIDYGIIGPLTCMGDHKPVYLRVRLVSDAGMINCCGSACPELFCFRVPESYTASERLLLSTATAKTHPITASTNPPDPNMSSQLPLAGCRSCARNAAAAAAAAASSSSYGGNNFLHAAPLQHDPYTPDSMDSPSPSAIPANLLGPSGVELNPLDQRAQQQLQAQRHPDRAVSPALLKSKLELIAQKRNRSCSSANSNNSNSDPEENTPQLNQDQQLQHGDNGDAGETGEDGRWSPRKSRSNSDVSWQRSHLLTRAWLQGKGHQAYHSFSSTLHRGHASKDGDVVDGPLRLTIGDSNNGHHHDDGHHYHNHLPGHPTNVVIPRIAIINASNFESNASSVNLHDDHHHCCSGSKKTLSKSHSSDQYLDTWYTNTRTRSLSEADSSQDRSPTTVTVAEEDDELRDKLDQENKDSKEDFEEDKTGVRELIKQSSEDCNIETKDNIAKVISEMKQESTAAGIVLPTASKNTTRSNSIQSQDANASLKLKAYNKVTERCKRNIVEKRSRCEKCCTLS